MQPLDLIRNIKVTVTHIHVIHVALSRLAAFILRPNVYASSKRMSLLIRAQARWILLRETLLTPRSEKCDYRTTARYYALILHRNEMHRTNIAVREERRVCGYQCQDRQKDKLKSARYFCSEEKSHADRNGCSWYSNGTLGSASSRCHLSSRLLMLRKDKGQPDSSAKFQNCTTLRYIGRPDNSQVKID